MAQRSAPVQAALCLVGCLHVMAFSALLLQAPVLFGKRGLQPVSSHLRLAAAQVLPEGAEYSRNPWAMLLLHPTLLWLHGVLALSAEAMLSLVCVAGLAAAVAVACGALHPLLFGCLWGLYLSAAGVGQAFLPQPGDELLLELTFAAIWLSSSSAPQPGAALRQRLGVLRSATLSPPVLLMRWLLFKLLLVSSSSKVLTVCTAASGLSGCYRAMLAHGQPHLLTWVYHALPRPLAALAAALALLELPAAFMVLCLAPSVQASTALALLSLQLARMALGGPTLVNLSAAVLCVALTDDSLLLPALQRVRRALPERLLAAAAGAGAGASASGAASAELLAYKPAGGKHKRSRSADSLASLLSEPEETAAADGGQCPLLGVRRLRGAGVSIALLGGGLLLLRPAPQQITGILQVLVPAVVLVWLLVLLAAGVQSLALAAAEPAAAAAAEPAVPRPANQATAKASPGLPSRPLSPRVAAAGAPEHAAGDERGGDPDEEPAAPAAGRRRAAAKSAAGRGGRGKASGAAAAEEANGDGAAEHHLSAAHKHKRATGRGRKPASVGEEPAAAAAGAAPSPTAPASSSPLADAVKAGRRSLEEASRHLAALGAAAEQRLGELGAQLALGDLGSKAAGRAGELGSRARLPELRRWVAARAPAAKAFAVAAVVLFVFIGGLPAVLAPAGFSPTALSWVPGLLRTYGSCRSFGLVSGSTKTMAAWEATAAAGGVRGGHNAFQLSTSADGAAWQPVRFRHAFGTAGLGGPPDGWAAAAGSLPGPHLRRLQGKLAAAGAGSLSDNMWLLSLADRVVQGRGELASALQQPPAQHGWVKIDLVRFSPTSAAPAGAAGAAQIGSWTAEVLDEVLPPMERGSPDLQEALQELGWADVGAEAAPAPAAGAAAAGSRGVAALALLAPPLLSGLLLAAAALRHLLLPGGLVHSAGTGGGEPGAL